MRDEGVALHVALPLLGLLLVLLVERWPGGVTAPRGPAVSPGLIKRCAAIAEAMSLLAAPLELELSADPGVPRWLPTPAPPDPCRRLRGARPATGVPSSGTGIGTPEMSYSCCCSSSTVSMSVSYE